MAGTLRPRLRSRGQALPALQSRPCMTATSMRAQPQSDHDTLLALNTDYINSVQHSDVTRFDEILSDDFYCSNPDGSLVDRAAFLRQTAKPVTITNLRAEDV